LLSILLLVVVIVILKKRRKLVHSNSVETEDIFADPLANNSNNVRATKKKKLNRSQSNYE